MEINPKSEPARKILFIDRDGVLIEEPKEDLQVDRFEKLTFVPGMLAALGKIARELDFELVLVTNQDGLGTDTFPREQFDGPHQLLIRTLAGEGIHFLEECIDTSFPEDMAPTRKPRTGMLQHYLSDRFDMKNSFVIGDRITDMELAKNLGCKGIFMRSATSHGFHEISAPLEEIMDVVALQTRNWNDIWTFLRLGARTAEITRTTRETDIRVYLDLDGTGRASIDTGLKFFDHMLEQIARHGALDITLTTKGDLEVDEHHTIEDTAIALGEAFSKALGHKIGIGRYGQGECTLPMDDAIASVALDFGGRSWLVWNASFRRERIGDMPTEMFSHFFKSFCDAARCNLNIRVEGENEHHKIEAIFKAFAKAIDRAKQRDADRAYLPSTKGTL